MKQFRWSKDALKLTNKKRTIETNISIGDAIGIVEGLEFDDVIKSIIIIDQDCEDWGVTEELFRYFAKTMLTYEDDGFDPLQDETIKLIEKLNKKFIKNEKI